MAILRRSYVRVTLTTLLVIYVSYWPIQAVFHQPSLPRAALVSVVGSITLAAFFWALIGAPHRRKSWLFLVTLAGSLVLQLIEPYSGIALDYSLVFAVPYRTSLRWAITLSTLDILGVLILFRATGFDPGATIGLTSALTYAAAFAFVIWHLSVVKRQGAEIAEARAAEAVLSERSRLAREVHDILAHSQSAQIVHLEGARLLLREGGDPAVALDRVERAVRLARAGLEETRRALDVLRGDDLPLAERLERLAAEFRAVTGATCRLSIEAGSGALAAEARLAVARTAQEALTNVRKHAPGAGVSVALRRQGQWCELEVRNDGGTIAPSCSTTDHGNAPALPAIAMRDTTAPPGTTGNAAPPTTTAPVTDEDGGETIRSDSGNVRSFVGAAGSTAAMGGGYGLVGMRERAALIGGSLSAQVEGEGFAVVLRVPA